MYAKQLMGLGSRSKRTKLIRYKILVMLVCSFTFIGIAASGLTGLGKTSAKGLNGVVNVVTDEGAKGDGIQNDTWAIQRAIDKVAPGGTVIIPKGLYKLSAGSKNKSSTGYGESQFSLKITKPMTIVMNGAVFRTRTKDNHGVFWIYRTSDVNLKGGSIKNNVKPEDGILTSRVGVLVQDSKRITIVDMYLVNLSQGINIYNSERSIVRNVTAENNKGSGIINFISRYSIIEGNTIRNSGDGNLSLYGGGHNNTVRNNTIVENRSFINQQQGITLEMEHDSLIQNNTVKGFYYGIDIKNGTESCLVERNITYNNQFNIAIRPGDGGGNLQEPSNYIHLYRNTVTNSKKLPTNAGILIKAGSGHIIEENIVNWDKLFFFGGTKINSNYELNETKFINNVFITKK